MHLKIHIKRHLINKKCQSDYWEGNLLAIYRKMEQKYALLCDVIVWSQSWKLLLHPYNPIVKRLRIWLLQNVLSINRCIFGFRISSHWLCSLYFWSRWTAIPISIQSFGLSNLLLNQELQLSDGTYHLSMLQIGQEPLKRMNGSTRVQPKTK